MANNSEEAIKNSGGMIFTIEKKLFENQILKDNEDK